MGSLAVAYKAHRLERPCLPHVKFRYLQEMPAVPPDFVPDYNAGPGHVFTATEQIVNMRRSMSPSQTGPQRQARDERQKQHQGSYQVPTQRPLQECPLQGLPGAHDLPMHDAFDEPFEIPKKQIDKLLQTSSQLELAAEVTPVQIWSTLSSISAQFPIGKLVLQALKSEFSKYVRCNRYLPDPLPSQFRFY